MRDAFTSAVAVLRSFVTAVITVAGALALLAVEVAPHLPNGWEDNAVAIGGSLTAAVAAATVLLQRLTPAPADMPRSVRPLTAKAKAQDAGTSAWVRAAAVAAVVVAVVLVAVNYG